MTMIRFRTPTLIFLVLIIVPGFILLQRLLSSLSSPYHTPVPARPASQRPSPELALFKGQDEKIDKADEIIIENGAKAGRRSVVSGAREVEVWGKASIAEYLWTHILGGNATTYANGLLKHGEMTVGKVHFRFRSGPGVVPTTVPTTTKYLVLVLNGNQSLKVKFARSWLDYLTHLSGLRRTALVVLGDERCDNEWLKDYLRSRGGVVDVVFVVYDSPLVDNREVFQWPLGVATYRGFPHFRSDLMNVKNPRKYLCNFLGTVYNNSSREKLVEVIKKESRQCLLATRDQWLPSESYASMDKYLRTLSESDLTLSPVGKNAESYRIYEALALGSVPVVEEGTAESAGRCSGVLRLLKAHKAPLVRLRSWDELPALLAAEARKGLPTRVARRRQLVEWYEQFKMEMRHFFIATLTRVFFNK